MASNYWCNYFGIDFMSDGGKGSKRRPQQVNNEIFEMNWDCIFQQRKEDAREQLEDANGVSDRRDDKRPAAQRGNVQPAGESSN